MKLNTPARLVLIISLAMAGVSFGQGNSGHDDRDRKEPPRRGHQQKHRADDRQPAGEREYRDRVDPRTEYRAYDRGAGPSHQFHRGERLSDEYRSRQYVVEDWREHELSPPPRGYHWVQTGTDYILVGVATGIILDMILNH